MLRSKPIVGLLGLLIALGTVLYFFREKEKPSTEPSLRSTDVTASRNKVDQPTTAPVSVSAVPVHGNRESSPKIGDPLSGAKTQADVAWLQRNGYPSAEMAQQVMTQRGAGAQLDQSRLIDPLAILSAEQLALFDPARRQEALDFLARSAQAGSIYALETLSRIYQGSDLFDPIRATAYMKAAEIRGNWAAGLALGKTELSAQQRMYATLMAHQIIQNLQRARDLPGFFGPPIS